MIPRYSNEKMSSIWSDRNRYEIWLKIEIAICEKLCIQKKQDRKKFFNSIGIDTIEIFTNKSLTDPIIKYFKFREKKH